MLTAIILYLTFAAICTVVLCAACMVSGRNEAQEETANQSHPSRAGNRAVLDVTPPH